MIIVVAVSTFGPIRVVPRSDLARSADLAVAIGYAPDGLPLVMRVHRSRDIFENLATVPGVRIGYRDDDLPLEEWHETSLDDPRAYRRALDTARTVAWWVPRHSLALALVAIAQSLQQMHTKGLVHGDVKPANLLLGEGGPVPIDPLGIESGRVATVCTPSWAAPEQVTARPVCPATDVFALGLVLARIVSAVVFGEERTFVVPTGGHDTRRMTVLSDPQVFIDPTAGLELRDPAVRAYASFIARCTSFDAEKRPANGAQFASERAGLLDRHPLPMGRNGFIDVGWLAGELHRRVDLLGDLQPAWVIADVNGF